MSSGTCIREHLLRLRWSSTSRRPGPVVAGTRITADVLFGRFEAGEEVDAIAADYDLTREQVELAIRCGQPHAAA